MKRRKLFVNVRLIAAALAMLVLGIGSSVLAQGGGGQQQSGSQVKRPVLPDAMGLDGVKPILTKSGKKAALKQAAEAAMKPAGRIAGRTMMRYAATGGSLPASSTDQTKVPHYFGPFPNWANTQLTVPDIAINIAGDGTGATANAIVGANGAVTGIVVTNPGSGYTNATVNITGAGTGATATAVINTNGAVSQITLTAAGAGYTGPTVTLSGGGGTGATATAYGGVGAVTVTAPGTGYSYPTVDFDLPDNPDGVQATAHAVLGANGSIASVVVDNPGSGYSFAPGVVIRDGTIYAPINNGAAGATASTTLTLQSVVVDSFGSGYTSAPQVVINDPNGAGATAIATVESGQITAIEVAHAGSGYLIPGIRKFVDTLPGLGSTNANNLGQYLPVAVPDRQTFADADYYEIALVEYTEQMHSDLPPTKLRGYVQLATGVVSGNAPLDGTTRLGVDKPHYLGPTIIAEKDRPVRITFYNLLPTGSGGDLFMPVDSTLMGAGPGNMTEPFDPAPTSGGAVLDSVRNPVCTLKSNRAECFTDNRATLHLHGGMTPWISDGTPHQWISPAGENTQWPEGVSVESVPDMVGVPGVPDCSGPNDGCMTFYYTNQQSARLLFYHDHSWGITRLNVYAGEAAGYVITDQTEQALIAKKLIPQDQIPLIVQDRTFVPKAEQLAWQDPTWDSASWGDFGNLWYHHVYMPAQNPGDPGGMSAFGRWMYGPWFWPPAGDVKYGPIANPYHTGTCNLDDPSTWDYATDPFCEPPLIPGTPNISAGMEQFNDTPVVNGTAYPTVTLQPKSYRLRILNAANDRFFNLQWYIGDPTTASDKLNSLNQPIGPTEVAFKAEELAAAQLDPVVFPTPDTTKSLPGPDWIYIGNEGGFLPAPVVVDGQQVTTWVTDPTRFDVGLVDQHSLLLAPAERADVIVDFSQFAGKTLILYNDAPAAFPARIPSYDYYTGGPDLSPVGVPTILPGYGPNTRTIMQVKIEGTPAAPFNLNALQQAFRHKADGSGVFESGQHPIIVGQAAYNSAYGTTFAGSGWCNSPSNPSGKCDGYARISEQGGDLFGFNTLMAPSSKMQVRIEPKAIHDETNASSYDEFGRMQANIGLEAVPATPGLQNVILYQYMSPPTEIIDSTNLPKAGVDIMPISSGSDGSQIWKITHNGVDTHPIHFHLYDVQVLNRVTWDNIIKPPHPTELGWKETVRVSPLEDTIVALRPVIPDLPFDIPNSIRLLSPMLPENAMIQSATIANQLGLGQNSFNPAGQPIDIINHYVNYGWEYVWHCHILSHEEMDMMRPQILAVPPWTPSNLRVSGQIGSGGGRRIDLEWRDGSRSETAFVIERAANPAGPWGAIATMQSTTGPNINDTISYSDQIGDVTQPYSYRVKAINVVGDTWNYADPMNQIVSGGFPTVTTHSGFSNTVTAPPPVTTPAAPSNLSGSVLAGPLRIRLDFIDRSANEASFSVWRSVNGGGFTSVGVIPRDSAQSASTGGSVAFFDAAVTASNTYRYYVTAVNAAGASAQSNIVTLSLTPPAAPANLTGSAVRIAGNDALDSVTLVWTDNSGDETQFQIQRSSDPLFTRTGTFTVAANATTFQQNVSRTSDYYYRVRAVNQFGNSGWSNVLFVTTP